jgi:hypothetical protein
MHSTPLDLGCENPMHVIQNTRAQECVRCPASGGAVYSGGKAQQVFRALAGADPSWSVAKG